MYENIHTLKKAEYTILFMYENTHTHKHRKSRKGYEVLSMYEHTNARTHTHTHTHTHCERLGELASWSWLASIRVSYFFGIW